MKKSFTLLLILCLLLSLVGCSNYEKSEYEVIGEMVDGAGRTIDIRSDREEATIASVYFVAAPFFVALNISDRVLAVNARNDFLKIADEGIKKAGTVGRGSVDLEKLASYNPTALVHRSNDEETISAVEKLGIDTICITVESADDITNTLKLLGEYFGATERAEEVILWMEKKFAYIDSIVEKIPNNERKTALLMGSSLGRVSGYDMMQSWMIKKAGGIPIVEEGLNHNWVDIGLEKVLSYNPDVIFCTSSSARNYTVDDILNDASFNAMKCVKNGYIYDMPSKYDSWDMPGLTCILGTLFMLREMYPDYISIEDFEDEVDDYYRFIFGRCFDSYLEIDYTKF